MSVVSALAKHLFPEHWPELGGFLASATQSENPQIRETGLLLFTAMFEQLPTKMGKYSSRLKGVFEAALKDASEAVRVQGLRASTQLLASLTAEEEVAEFKGLVIPMMQVVQQCLRGGDEDIAAQALMAVDELVEGGMAVFNGFEKPFCEFLLGIISRPADSLEMTTKDKAGELLRHLIANRPNAIAKAKMIPTLVVELAKVATRYEADPTVHVAAAGAGLAMGGTGAQSDRDRALLLADQSGPAVPGSGEERGDGSATTDVNISARLFDTMANHVKSKHLFKPLLTTAAQCLQSQTWQARRAGFMMMAVAVEGLRSPFRDGLQSILTLALKHARDQSPAVRDALAWFMSQLGEYLPLFVLRESALVMPPMLALLKDPNEAVQAKAVFFLANLLDTDTGFEHLGSRFREIMAGIAAALRHPQLYIRLMAVQALSSAAVASRAAFTPYFESAAAAVMPMMAPVDGDELLELRGLATDALGHMAAAVGRERWEALCTRQPVMRAVQQNLTLKNERLMEYTFSFFGQLSSVMKDSMQPVLPGLVETLAAACVSTEGVTVAPGRAHGLGMSSEVGELSARMAHLGADEQADEDPDAPVMMRVRAGASEMKCAAIFCLGALAENVGAPLIPHRDRILTLLGDMVQFYDDNVREHVVNALGRFAKHLAVHPAPGEDVTTPPAAGFTVGLSTKAAGVFADMGLSFINIVEHEDSRDVVGAVLDVLASWVKSPGPHTIGARLTALVGALQKLLRGTAFCQHPYDSDEEEDDDEAAAAAAAAAAAGSGIEDHEPVVMDPALDLIAQIAKSGGPGMEPHLKPLLPDLHRYASQPFPDVERATSIGCIGEVAEGLREAFAPYCDSFVRLILDALQGATKPELQHNCVWSLGMICSVTGATASKHIPSVLRLLPTVLRNPKPEWSTARDNAAGAIARIATAFPAAVPVDAALALLVPALPLTADRLEDMPIWAWLASVVQAGNPKALEAIPALVRAAAPDLTPSRTLEPKARLAILSAVQVMRTAQPQAVDAAVAGLPPAGAAMVRRVLERCAAQGPVAVAREVHQAAQANEDKRQRQGVPGSPGSPAQRLAPHSPAGSP